MKCQTDLPFISEAGQFLGVACGATKSWPVSRLMLAVLPASNDSWAITVLAGRSLAAICGRA